MAIIVEGITKCPICGAELRSNGKRYGRKQYYCKGTKTHYHRSGTQEEVTKPKQMTQISEGISEQDFRRQFDNRYILREAVKKLQKGQLIDQRKFVQNLKLQGAYKDTLEEADFEPFRGRVSADKVFWSHPDTITKLKEENLLK